MDRPERHSIDRLKETESRKGAADIHTPRSRTICVQRDKHWHYFEVNLAE